MEDDDEYNGLFTQSLAYLDSPNNHDANSNEHENLNGDTEVFTSLNYLNSNVKKLIHQQTKQFSKLSQNVEQQMNQLSTQQTIDLNDNVSVYLNYTLKPLLNTVKDEPLKFAKLQNKIQQIIIEELEKQRD